MDTARSSVIHNEFEQAYELLRAMHPDIRPAIFAIYMHDKGDRNGHYWKSAWNVNGKDGTIIELDEMHISSHLLAEPAENVLETMLHECAHSVGITREIKNTTRGGRYHNGEFKKLAIEMDLVVERDTTGKYGFITTAVQPDALPKYAEVLKHIEAARVAYQDFVKVRLIKRGGKKRSGGLKKMTCWCGHIIYASRKVMDNANISCEDCGANFEEA